MHYKNVKKKKGAGQKHWPTVVPLDRSDRPQTDVGLPDNAIGSSTAGSAKEALSK